jgi:hypothetical protein
MRITSLSAGILLLTSAAAGAASADYYLKIDGVSGDPSSGVLYLRVAGGDLDGDGVPDAGVIKLACSRATLDSAQYTVTSPRDIATGQASGKRMHKPFTIVKEWGAASPQLAKMTPSYDIKKVEGTGARIAGDGPDWAPITLANADGLCGAAAAAVVKTKTKSNQSND